MAIYTDYSMKNIFIIFVLISGVFQTTAQITNVEEKFPLPEVLNESSGVIFFNNKLISHNDSGHENKLYELDTVTGSISRTVTITNATNVDWEDITQDDTSIYIGDIGNSNGDRVDLKVYKIAKNDYLASTNVIAEIIHYSYSDQIDFTYNPTNTVWDAEALISFDENNLILFTKNWVDGITKAYPIPKTSGTYTVDPMPSILQSGGLITGATYNPATEKVYFIGYTSLLRPFIWVSEGFEGDDIFSGNNWRKSLTRELGFEQVEGITHVGANSYFITSESFTIPPISDYGKLISFSTNDEVLSTIHHSTDTVSLYPNPVKNILFIDVPEFTSVEVYDVTSKLIFRRHSQKLDFSQLHEGLYILKIHLADGAYVIKKVIKK